MADLIPTEVDDEGDERAADDGGGSGGGAAALGSGAAGSAAATPAVPGPPGGAAPVPGNGTAIGRFTVLGLLGIGGMGVVLSAYDPDLDRKVALKLLRGDQFRGARAAAGRAALLREAKAMARLNHPNVVAVYEAGVLEGSGYVVMEQVEGITLRRWLDEPRGWEEILDVLLAAGHGLAAAHRAGVVHRDFKPENVLVGKEGRVRVSDFGLAGEGGGGRGTLEYMAPETRDARATRAAHAVSSSSGAPGGAAGTPGSDALAAVAAAPDARSDLYAYCITVWEALHGERPVTEHGPPPLPANRKAPSWVYAALLRGLAVSPDERWPSMDALLARLGRLRRGVGRLAIAAIAAVLLIGVAAFFVGRERARAPSCASAEDRLVGAWDPARRSEVERAFAAKGLRFGAAAWPAVAARVDAFAGGWSKMYNEACHATHVEGRQSAVLLDLRMECLDRRRGVLANLTSLWAKGMTAELVEASLESALGLPPLAPCADARTLTGKIALPDDPEKVRAIAATRAQIDAAFAMLLAHQRVEAQQVMVVARAAADATGWPQVRAEAALVDGKVLSDLYDAGAEPRLLEAARLAGAARDDKLAADAMVELVQVLSENQQLADRALLVASITDGLVARAGDEPGQRVLFTRFRAAALRVKGDFVQARAVLAEARAPALAAFGEGSWDLSVLDGELSRIAEAQGDYAEARQLGEQVLKAAIVRFGPQHPRVAAYLNNLAMAADAGGDPKAARAYHQRALQIKVAVLGEDSPSVALTLNNLGIVEVRLGNLTEALAQLERALAIRERVLGPEHPYVATTLGNLSTIYLDLGRFDEALAAAQRALAIKLKAYGPDNAFVANSLHDVARLRAVQGDHAQALELFRRSAAAREKVFGADHEKSVSARVRVAAELGALGRCGEAQPILLAAVAASVKDKDAENEADALSALADCDLAAGASARALPRLARAVELLAGGGDDIEVRTVGAARWQLGRAQWAVGQRVEAVASVRAAERELATVDTDLETAPLLKAARAWLAVHGKQASR